jgi:PPK2 family polyphosphate:nucleotide phosphotransferase
MDNTIPDYQRYRVEPGAAVDLASLPTRDTQGFDRDAARKIYKRNLKAMDKQQEQLYAESRQSLLLVLQAMDTAGKDSTIRKVAGSLNPQGCLVTGFKKPTATELAHDFLWRIHQHAPRRGHIGIFNRSHYEDVLVVRVHGLVSPEAVERRYDRINEFERLLADDGTRIIKIMLHVSKEYQLVRLRNRLRNPEKHWKFNPADIKERALWDDYMGAYEIALKRCSTDYAPWYVVPAETRWFRDALVSQLMVDTLHDMNPRFPPPDFDPADYPPESLE